MVKYNCLRCGYITDMKSSMVRHLNRKTVCPLKNFDTVPSNYRSIILKENGSELDIVKRLLESEKEIGQLKEEIKTLKLELESNNKQQGNLYILWNPMFDEDVYKLGCSKNPDQRLKGYSTSYQKPSEFKYVSKLFPNKLEVEKILFKLLKNYRMEKNREFFKINIDNAINTIKDLECQILN